jgi:hypothetical protein
MQQYNGNFHLSGSQLCKLTATDKLAYINIAERDISKSRNLAVMVSGASRDSQETNSDRAPTHSTHDLLEDKKLLHLYVSY